MARQDAISLTSLLGLGHGANLVQPGRYRCPTVEEGHV